MKFDVTQAIEVLQATPQVLRSLLGGLSEPWVRNNYGEGTFSPFDVVGHLIHGEKTDWMVRLRIILEHGEARPFDPYDRYAQFEESRGKSRAQLLDEFDRLRRANLAALSELRLRPEKLALRGTHPALGSVTAENLLATWVAHDLSHIAQIARCMATRSASESASATVRSRIVRPSISIRALGRPMRQLRPPIRMPATIRIGPM
jgi:hypothetical protein